MRFEYAWGKLPDFVSTCGGLNPPPRSVVTHDVVDVLRLLAAIVPRPEFPEKGANSPDISKAFSRLGMWRFESFPVSQPVRQLKFVRSEILEAALQTPCRLKPAGD
jgi:hypothetical protein